MSRFHIPQIPHNPLMSTAISPINRAIHQINELGNMTGQTTGVQRGPIGTIFVDRSVNHLPVEFLGVLVDGGPGTLQGVSQPDFTDSRYWVRQIVLNQTQGASMSDPLTASVDASTLDTRGNYGGALWVVAVNLQESLTGTHLLPLVSASIALTAPLGATATIVLARQVNVSKWTTLPNDMGNMMWVFEPITNTSGTASVLQKLGSITGYTGVGPVEWNPYQVTFQDSTTANAYNTKEPVDGSPGSLGLAVGTDGSVTGSSCFVVPIGNDPKPRVFTFDSANSRWIFTDQNSAG